MTGAAPRFFPIARRRCRAMKLALGRAKRYCRWKADRVCATPVLAPGEEWDVWHTQCSELAKLQGSVPDTDR
jgi:hypothetical protein